MSHKSSHVTKAVNKTSQTHKQTMKLIRDKALTTTKQDNGEQTKHNRTKQKQVVLGCIINAALRLMSFCKKQINILNLKDRDRTCFITHSVTFINQQIDLSQQSVYGKIQNPMSDNFPWNLNWDNFMICKTERYKAWFHVIFFVYICLQNLLNLAEKFHAQISSRNENAIKDFVGMFHLLDLKRRLFYLVSQVCNSKRLNA